MLRELSDPGPTYRPIPLWSWNDRLSEREVRRQIGEMAEAGYGGFFMHARVGLLTPYLGEEWFHMVGVCVEEAERRGMHAWIYDEDKWPSGYAGGRVALMGAEHRLKGIYAAPAAHAPRASDDSVVRRFTRSGEPWVVAVHTTPLGDRWFNEAAYVDLMNPATVDAFLELTLGAYQRAVGEHFGTTIPGVFTDEPCYQFFGHKRGLLPWTPELPAYFLDCYGYDLTEWLELLFCTAGEAGRTDAPPFSARNTAEAHARVRHDFFAAASQRFTESFTRRYHERTRALGLIFTGHFMSEDTLESQTTWIGAAMPNYEHMDWPGIDKLGRHVAQNVTVKQVSSVADQLSKQRTFSEVFGCAGQDFTFSGQRWIHGWQAVLGINVLDPHLALYTMAGERKRDFPANLFYQQPWWVHQNVASAALARLNLLMTHGRRRVDIAVIHPIATAWAVYDITAYAADRENPAASYDRRFAQLTDALLSARLDFHYVDETVLARHGAVDRESSARAVRLTVGSAAYTVVVVPPVITLSRTTVELLAAFHDGGGTVVTVGAVPRWIEMREPLVWERRFPAATAAAVAADALRAAASVPAGRIVVEDRDLADGAPTVYLHERTVADGGSIVMLANTAEHRHLRLNVTFRSDPPEHDELPLWRVHLEHGTRERLRTVPDTSLAPPDRGAIVPIDLAPGEPVVILRGQDRLWSDIPVSGRCLCIDAPDLVSQSLEVTVERARVPDCNAFPVDSIDLWIDDAPVLTDAPLSRVWDRFFYELPDGTRFRARYHVTLAHPPHDPATLALAVERASNLERLRVNGTDVHSDGSWWIDPAFQRVDVGSAWRGGENVVEITGRKYNSITKGGDGVGYHRVLSPQEAADYIPTDLDAIYVIGSFRVPWDRRGGSCIVPDSEPVDLRPDIADITRAGFPFYAGRVEVTLTVRLDRSLHPGERLILSVAEVRMSSCAVTCNGRDVEVRVWEPWRWDLTEYAVPGLNRVIITGTTDLFNLLGPHSEAYSRPLMVGPSTFRDSAQWSPVHAPQPRGMHGFSVHRFPAAGERAGGTTTDGSKLFIEANST